MINTTTTPPLTSTSTPTTTSTPTSTPTSSSASTSTSTLASTLTLGDNLLVNPGGEDGVLRPWVVFSNSNPSICLICALLAAE
ncbi:unnamed protein product [Adineta steineri]|uniref:Uncharacterized protein n=1 Tax=Adineta steineri TaxID=433720 RepID=A0A819WHT2_9BILA|nr:unnamed protein product [Adineta steineri]